MTGFLVEVSGVTGLYIAIRRHRLGGLAIVLEVASEHPRRFKLHFAVFGDANIDIRTSRTDGVGINFTIRLSGDVEKGFGLAIKLLQIQADRAIEVEQIGPNGSASRIGDSHA